MVLLRACENLARAPDRFVRTPEEHVSTVFPLEPRFLYFLHCISAGEDIFN